jgi:hypothetical protein
MLYRPLGTQLHRYPKRLPYLWDGLWVTSYKHPGGKVDTEAGGIGVQDCRGVDFRLSN